MERGESTGGRGKKTTLWKVLEMLVLGYERDKIRAALSISMKRFYFLRKKLIETGYLDGTGHPTGKKGVNEVYTGSNVGGYVSSGKLVPKFVRLHRVQVKVPVFRWWKKSEGKCLVQWGNARYWQEHVAGARVRIFDKCLDVYLPVFWGDTVEDCDQKMLKWFIDWVCVAQELLGCKCAKDEGVTDWVITKREYAFVGAQNARQHVKNREVIKVIDERGSLRYVVDQSLGVPEFEAVNPSLSASDARHFQELYLDVAKGRWHFLQLGVAQMGEVLKQDTAVIVRLTAEAKRRGWFGDE